MKPARTRFAVSPTGFMHVGGVRNALFDWLVARQSGGQFILRIEDTDQAREVPGAVEHIMETLEWLGLTWDEGPKVGGPQEPYVQSQRLDIYREWAQKLVDKGRAYADPYTPEQVQAFRDEAQKAKKPFLFRDHRPENPPAWDGTQPLRLKSDPKPYSWDDGVMGTLSAGAEAVDDFVLMKSDGFPTYNFCHIIDDYLMDITHIIRSQEFVASMPRFLNLYEALEFPQPAFAHLPWIMGPDGRKKLSKRDGAKDVLDYKREGYLPETILNFLASLGWNDGTTQEVFTVDELVQKFSLGRVQHGGAKFDEQRLIWMNGAHIRALPLDELMQRASNFWPEQAAASDDAYKKTVLGLVQERLKYLGELPALTSFFFTDLPVNRALWKENKQLKKLPVPELKQLLQQSRDAIASSDFTVDDLTAKLNSLLEQTGQKPGVLFSLVRIATTQAPASPGLADTLAVMGKEIALRRIDAMLVTL
jgi:glutamyl-tRNA synthetase